MLVQLLSHNSIEALKRVFEMTIPMPGWLRTYSVEQLYQDLVAALIVTILLIPQSLAYAMLAGLPPQMGLFASIMPLMVYAVLGSSRTLSVGPVAVISLMTATAIGAADLDTLTQKMLAAGVLALMSGAMMILAGVLRIGRLANYISHPVTSGFISASAVLIAVGQLGHVFGVNLKGHAVVEQLLSFGSQIDQINLLTLAIGSAAVLLLVVGKSTGTALLTASGLSSKLASILSKAWPLGVIFGGAVIVASVPDRGVAIVGTVTGGLPNLQLPWLSFEQVQKLMMPAALIAVIGVVESLSVGQALAVKRRQNIAPNQELVALGGANVASAVCGGFPVTGGFSRSVVNFDAGAQTQMASVFTAFGIGFATMFLTPFLYYIPKAVLAATIIIAVLGLIDFGMLTKTWRFAKADFMALVLTIGLTLAFGVELGLVGGVTLSILLHLTKSSRPHIAEVGLVSGTEHFRNVKRHNVATRDDLLTLRLDESLYFANAKFLENEIAVRVALSQGLAHVVLQCSAINALDTSALESLERINARLNDAGIRFHLSEVKGPVMDRLQRSNFLDHLTGKVHRSQFEAFTTV